MSERSFVAGAASLNQTPLDFEGNQARIVRAIADARKRGIELLCLPELAVTGYGCEDMFLAPWVAERAWAALRTSIAPASQGIAVAVGLPVRHEGRLYNAAALVCDGRIVGVVPKQFLANDGVHYEPRWFTPWERGRTVQLNADSQVPLGDWVFSFSGVRVGFEICEDAWVKDRPAHALHRRGVQLFLHPSASHFAFGKHAVREGLMREASESLAVTYLFANLLGNEAGRIIYDGGTAVFERGVLRCAGPRFSFTDHSLVACPVALPKGVVGAPDEAGVVDVAFRFGEGGTQTQTPAAEPAKPSPLAREEAFAHAVTLGLFDYLRKSRARGYAISLSGGVDSAACAVLVSWMVQRGIAALGVEAFFQRLGVAQPPEGHTPEDVRSLVRGLLLTVYQGTEHSSEATRTAAEAVAEAVGSEHHVLDVQPLVDSYRAQAEWVIGRPLTWTQDDLALQNIQSRVRAPSIWLLANLRGRVVCTTGNRSEAAVGYVTMDGDTAGGLAPIGGVDKAFLRRWMRWAEKEAAPDCTPVAALEFVNALAPTAELRPRAAGQSDEADLMPYEVLDALERAYLVDRLAPAVCCQQLEKQFPGHELADLRTWCTNFFQLWTANQWKRERLAPSFHVDDHNVDPRTWCRHPILSSPPEDLSSQPGHRTH